MCSRQRPGTIDSVDTTEMIKVTQEHRQADRLATENQHPVVELLPLGQRDRERVVHAVACTVVAAIGWSLRISPIGGASEILLWTAQTIYRMVTKGNRRKTIYGHCRHFLEDQPLPVVFSMMSYTCESYLP